MTARIEERRRGRIIADTSGSTLYREYDLIYADEVTLQTAYDDLNSYARAYKRLGTGRVLTRMEIEETEESISNHWSGRLEWGALPKENEIDYPEEPLEILAETFSSEGGTAHIKDGLDETIYSCPNETARTNYCGIGWNGEDNEGTDIVVPTFSFQLEKEFDYEDVTAQVKTYWANMTGKVNSDLFNGFDPGTILFMGVSGATQVTYDDTLVTKAELINGEIVNVTYKKAKIIIRCQFKFRCAPNWNQLEVAGVNITKTGWQYYWVLKEPRDILGARTRLVPVGVYVNTVYRTTSFSDLLL